MHHHWIQLIICPSETQVGFHVEMAAICCARHEVAVMHKHGTPQHGMFSTQNGQGRASQMQLRVQTSVHGVVDEVRIKVCRCMHRQQNGVRVLVILSKMRGSKLCTDDSTDKQ